MTTPYTQTELSVLLNMADAAALFFSPRYLPALTEPPIASMKPTPKSKAKIGMSKFTAASASTPTKLPIKMPSTIEAELKATIPTMDGSKYRKNVTTIGPSIA